MVKRTLALATRILYPAARCWARQGYFAETDWSRIQAKRIALVACHWLGDTLWATQVLQPLRHRFPDAEFHAVTKPASVDLWNGWLPREKILTTRAITSDMHRERTDWRGLLRVAREHRSFDWDLVVDLTGNQFSATYSFLVRAPRSLGFGGGLKLNWLYSHRVPEAERPGCHLSERPFRVIEPLLAATKDPFPYPPFPRPPEPTCTPSELLAEVGLPADRPLYVLAPGAGWPEKEWPPESFSSVGQALSRKGASILVTGSPSQESLCGRVASKITGARVSLALIGRVNAAFKVAAGVLANDSAPAHLAAAYGRRTAVIFTGATDPKLYRPLGPEEQVRIFPREANADDVAGFLSMAL